MQRSRGRAAWLGPGVTASLALTGTTLGLRALAGVPSLPEMVEDGILALIPGEVFSLALDRLGYLGKPVLLVGLVGVLLATGVAGAALLLRLVWLRLPASGRLAWLAFGVAVGSGLGAVLAIGLSQPAIQVVPFVVYGLVLGALAPVRPGVTLRDAAGRRRSIELIVGGLGALATAVSLDQLIGTGLEAVGSAPDASPAPEPAVAGVPSDQPAASIAPPPPPGAALPTGVSPAITPTPSFYIVSKNFVDPVVQAEGWSVELGGLVERPLTLSYPELLDLPAVEVERTLECISNPIGGPQISNAIWRGVPLDDLLERVGVLPEATEAVFSSVDNYLEHLTLEHLRRGTTLLVHTINGEPLPPRHGFPVRLLTTGLYGMKNPKWLRKIELTDRLERGYWERRGWTPTAPIRTMARIDVPRVSQRVSQPDLIVGGIAFAGDRGIQRVEVSLDEGRTWIVAEHETDRPPSTWTRWAARVVLPDRSSRQLMVRATDGLGEVQDSAVRRTFPSGGSGYHRVLVEWAEASFDTPGS
jgi:DMSO/TMAO reductase YedYZ molybdopterin-dependent catalytic subunit